MLAAAARPAAGREPEGAADRQPWQQGAQPPPGGGQDAAHAALIIQALFDRQHWNAGVPAADADGGAAASGAAGGAGAGGAPAGGRA